MKKIKPLSLFLLLIPYMVFSQDVNNISNTRPVASQSLSASDASNSVDLYTGKLNYGVNLKTVSLAGIGIPVGLSYTTSGFKVQEMPSNTGLGWSLGTKMVITRSVHGLPDDNYYGYCGSQRTGGNYYGSMDKNLLEQAAGNVWDSEPDTFYFSFLGFSGSFELDPDGNAVLQSAMSGIKVLQSPYQRNNVMLYNTWILEDQHGNKYYLGGNAIESVTDLNHHEKSNSSDFYTSSWYMTSIITAANQVINFSYEIGSPVSYTNYTTISRHVTNSAICTGNTDAIWAENTDVSYAPIYLKKIAYKNISIDFEYHQDRIDLVNSKALTDVKISFRGIISDHFILNYGYFTSNDGSSTKRLKLDHISQYYAGAITKTLFSFLYNEQINLPSRNSLQTDYWGYFNSNSTGSNLVGIADKTPDSVRTKANVLVKVSIGLGGSTYFAYEQNTILSSQLPIVNIPTGGIRLRKSYNKKFDSDLISYNGTDYIYDLKYAPGESSGQSLVDMHIEPVLEMAYSCDSNTGSEIFRQSESLTNVFDDNGSPVGYSYVTVKNSDGSGVRYNFSTSADYNDKYEEGLYTVSGGNNTDYSQPKSGRNKYPVTSYSFARGKLQSEEILDNNGQLLKQTIYSYALTAATNFIIGIKPYLLYYTNIGDIGYNYGKYKFFTQDLRLTAKTETDYKNGVASQSVIQNYAYTDYAANLIRSISTTISGGKADKQMFRYDFDVIPSIPNSSTTTLGTLYPLTTMVYNNYIAKPVEVIHSVIQNNNEKIISANITQYYTFNYGRVFPSNEFALLTNGPLTDYTPYTVTYAGGAEVNNRDYRMTATTNYISYDDFGNAAEVQPVAAVSSFNSTIVGYNGLYKIADIVNAPQSEVAYTSFESDETGNWLYAGSPEFDLNAATGNKCYNFSTGDITRNNLTPSHKYVLTYWTKNTAALSVTGTQGSAVMLADRNGWRLFKHVITGLTTITLSGSGYVDEIRLLPQGAKMATYTYEPNVGVSSKTTENNECTYYEYDEFNRLLYVKDHDKNITQANCYNQKGDQTNCFAFFKNAPVSASVYKNDCGPGYQAAPITYTIEAGKYSASSQAAADALAQEEVSRNAQTYANNHGTCTQFTIYARLTVDNYQTVDHYHGEDNYSSSSTANIIVTLYQDAAGTVPYYPTVPININISTDLYIYPAYGNNTHSVSTNTYTIGANTCSYEIDNVPMDSSQTYPDPYWGNGDVTDYTYYNYSLVTDPYYVII